MEATEQLLRAEADSLYDRFVRPLERERWGEYAAVSGDGEVIVAGRLTDLLRETEGEDSPDLHIFRIGPRVAGRWL